MGGFEGFEGFEGRCHMLKIELLENVKKRNGKITARCPACAEDGKDTKGEHLTIYPDGKFGCCVFSGNDGTQHRKRIYELVGDKSTQKGVSRYIQYHDNDIDIQKRHQIILKSKAEQKIKEVIRSKVWTYEDVKASSPLKVNDSNCHDPRLIINLYPKKSVIWTGEQWQSGEKYGQERFKNREVWLDSPSDIGSMITPSTWKPDILSRSIVNVDQNLFTVLDFDELPSFISNDVTLHQLALSVTRWLREELNWTLVTIIDTGNKSLHAWFDSKSCDFDGLKNIAEVLGLDRGLIGRPEHPCRLPNVIHQKSGKRSSILWLTDQNP